MSEEIASSWHRAKTRAEARAEAGPRVPCLPEACVQEERYAAAQLLSCGYLPIFEVPFCGAVV